MPEDKPTISSYVARLSAYAARFPTYFTANPNGAPFVPQPWQDIPAVERQTLPLYLRFRLYLRALLLAIACMLLYAGLVASFNVYFAFGVALLAVIGLAYRAAWKASGQWRLSPPQYRAEVRERQDFEVTMSMRNTGPRAMHGVSLYLEFQGSTRRAYYHFVKLLPPFASATITFRLTPDKGMGTFALGTLLVSVRGPVGLNALTVEYPWHGQVTVLPEDIPLATFDVERAGLSMHAGDFEVKMPGHSASFLGLREWRTGDSMNHIDWKRSLRTGELLVKEFERMCATDATIFVDQGTMGHGEFSAISSMEAMRDSILSLTRCLIAQQMRVQLISAHVRLPFGASRAHVGYLIERVAALKPAANTRFTDLVYGNLAAVPADSVAVLLFCTANVQFNDLMRSLIVLDNRRVETTLVAFDSEKFVQQIQSAANLGPMQGQLVYYLSAQLQSFGKSADMRRLIHKLASRTFVIEPGQTFADVYHRRYG